MTNETIPQNYNQNTGFWERDKKIIQSDYLCRPYILEELGEIKNLRVADIGCGEGYLSRILASKGAKVTSLDISEGLINKATEKEAKERLGIDYSVGSALDLTKFKSQDFDLAISSLVYGHFTKSDVDKAISETNSILKLGGRFVLAVPHPFMYICKPKSGWITFDYDSLAYSDTAQPNITLFTGDKRSFKIPARTHKIESYINGLLKNGFSLEHIVEPSPTEKDLLEYPEIWGEETKLPSYLILNSKKVKGGNYK